MYQKWSPSKCIKSLLWIGLFSSPSLWAEKSVQPHIQPVAQPSVKAAESKTIPNLLKEVEVSYSKAATLSADFIQINDNAALSQKKKSSGKIFLKRPSQVRWETQKPDPNLFVSNGKKSWFYTPPFDEGERGQVIVRKTSETQSKLANALLAGSFSVVKDMKIEQKSETTFALFPKRGTAGTIQQATIEVDPGKKQIQKVILDHRGGNRSEISLSNIQLGIVIKDELFNFVPPPNTDEGEPE